MIKVTIGNNIRRSTIVIDEDTTTLRSALEANEIDYTVGMTSLDGSTLKAGDLDKTFKEFGVTEKCYLLNVVKADNAASINVIGSACVIVSGHKLDDIKKLQKYNESALNLYTGEGKDKEIDFAVRSGKGMGSVNGVGVSFGANANDEGYATVTIIIPDGTTDVKKFVHEVVGKSILKLNKVEEQITPAIAAIDAEIAAIDAKINIM